LAGSGEGSECSVQGALFGFELVGKGEVGGGGAHVAGQHAQAVADAKQELVALFDRHATAAANDGLGQILLVHADRLRDVVHPAPADLDL
jgi:hypothetical protein